MLTRGFVVVPVALAAVTTVAVSAAAPDRKAPRIVSAVMQDTNRDTRADRVKLTYSARVRHARDRDGRYPFTVFGYRIRSVEVAAGKTLVIALVEQARPDPTAKPAIRYRLTRSNPVTGREGLQAVAQLYRAVRPHGNAPPPPPPPLPPPPPPPPGARDSDGDGTPDAQDCAPQDPAVHLRAPDPPDLGFLDANCDGIDGEEAKAIFVSPVGSDVNPGSKAQPKRQIQAAVDVAAGKDRYVLAAAGSYARVAAATGVGIYGGYDAASWSRKADLVTSIAGSPEGVYAESANDVILQLLSVQGTSGGESAYGIRAISDSSLRLERVTVVAGDAATGVAGVSGLQGAPGSSGQAGGRGACDSFVRAIGGAGGASPVSRDGGKGGNGYYEIDGEDGGKGLIGTPGGKGGDGGQPASDGRRGSDGTEGSPGARGSGGDNLTALASTSWRGRTGSQGIYAAPGNGGGGGGGGGGQDGFFVTNGSGNGGGGGGGGAAGGRGGEGGGAGGGSFGIYLHNSAVVAEASSITAGNGGAGGRGGNGGSGGVGGGGGPGNGYCVKEIGRGGTGGRGGNGGQGGGGGGGAGGPSIGFMKVGASSAILTSTAVVVGAGGPGGAAGAGGSGTPPPSQTGIVQAVYP